MNKKEWFWYRVYMLTCWTIFLGTLLTIELLGFKTVSEAQSKVGPFTGFLMFIAIFISPSAGIAGLIVGLSIRINHRKE